MTSKEATEQYFAEAHKERKEARAEGIAYFDGSAAWEKFCKQMAEEIGPGKLKDDFEDA
ncbi:hypothetical protein [Pseudomonas sp. B1(2018)]|uniref:hypothetical protein n=1 Tax=Pseudomonas sp. B1(2018) TaxID=2233856 RepID=UPI0014027678|nr:hypothetical protein [Pseudomonas sp. B1(2018)]